MFRAKVIVTLKKGVSDPQGQAVQNALKTMQFQNIGEVRVGKYIEVLIHETDEALARSQVQSICEKLLVNLIIEQFQFYLARV